MAKKLKDTNPIIDNSTSEKKGYVYLGDYFCLKDMQPKPVTENFLRMLASKMLEWVDLEDSLAFTQFFRITKIRSQDFYKWKNRSEDLSIAYEHSREIIGSRREIGAIKRQYDGHFIGKTLYQYLPEYGSSMEYVAKLSKNDTNINTGTQFVVLPKIESVPEMEQYFKKVVNE